MLDFIVNLLRGRHRAPASCKRFAVSIRKGMLVSSPTSWTRTVRTALKCFFRKMDVFILQILAEESQPSYVGDLKLVDWRTRTSPSVHHRA